MSIRVVVFILAISGFVKALAEECTAANKEAAVPREMDLDDQKKRYFEAAAAYEASRKKITEEWAEQSAEAKQQEKAQAELLRRAELATRKQESVIDLSIKNQERFAKILDGWEKQQAQYQKFLDSQKGR